MNMEILKFNETFLPIRKVLLDGRTVAARSVLPARSDKIQLKHAAEKVKGSSKKYTEY